MKQWPCDDVEGLSLLVRLVISRQVPLVEVVSLLSLDFFNARCSVTAVEPPAQRRKLQHKITSGAFSSASPGVGNYCLRLTCADDEILQFALQSSDIVGFCFRAQRVCSCCALFHRVPGQFVADTDEGGRMEWTMQLDGVFGSTVISTRDNIAVILNANFSPFIVPDVGEPAACLAVLSAVDSILNEDAGETAICQVGRFLNLDLLQPASRKQPGGARSEPMMAPGTLVSNTTLLRGLGIVFGPLPLSLEHIRNVVLVINTVSRGAKSCFIGKVPRDPSQMDRSRWEALHPGLVDQCNAALVQAVSENIDTFSRACRSKPLDAQRAVLCRSIAESITEMVMRSRSQSFVETVCSTVGVTAATNKAQLVFALEEHFLNSDFK
jgi:hypothetical protein